MSKLSRTSLTGSQNTRPAEPLAVPPGFEKLAYVLKCSYGHYPWADWERTALAAGVPQDLAGLGRATLREAFQHDWDAPLKSLCGWSDDGQALLAYALRFPKAARRRWEILMRTDGLRGDYRPRSPEWIWGYLRSDAQRLRLTL